MSGFFQKTLIYVIILSIGTLSVGFGLSYYAASLSTCLDGFNLNTKLKKSIFNALAPICASISSPFVNFAIQKFGRRDKLLKKLHHFFLKFVRYFNFLRGGVKL